jgi:4-hydroxybenzoate polyprenyltransferase
MASESAIPGPVAEPTPPGDTRIADLTVLQSAVALVRTLRPQQWVKNVFVAAPLVFAQKLGHGDYVARCALASLAFCALSGAVYAFNDVRDAAADRLHPTKRARPIAAGMLSQRAALICSGVLALGALAGCFLLSGKLAAVAALYLAQNVAYTLRFKQIAFVDVALIASGYLLRVLAGAIAIAVPTSGWLLVCTALLALMLGFGKRAHELAWAMTNGRAAKTRAALAGYRLDVLRITLFVLAAATCACFVAYTLAERTVAEFGTNRLVYSAPLVAIAILRFLDLALWHPSNAPPTEAMLKDPWFLVDVASAVGVMLYVIYA